MSNYTLYNKSNDKRLMHPKIGLWFTPSLGEAKEMLKACHEYLKSMGLEKYLNDFVILDVENNVSLEN